MTEIHPPFPPGLGNAPTCDTFPPEQRARQLADENRRLRERVAELEAALIPREGWGHSGPCKPRCTCDVARAGQ